ncbi:hypothetical protein DV702_04920 [Sporosarcina sp. PTS2304]|nr:hypothetical protein DV702_04920 [Sporosarcina sp. PTS2304]
MTRTPFPSIEKYKLNVSKKYAECVKSGWIPILLIKEFIRSFAVVLLIGFSIVILILLTKRSESI